MDSLLWSARMMVGVGFLMLFLTSLQGWGMVGIIAFWGTGWCGTASRVKAPFTILALRRFLAISSWARIDCAAT